MLSELLSIIKYLKRNRYDLLYKNNYYYRSFYYDCFGNIWNAWNGVGLGTPHSNVVVA